MAPTKQYPTPQTAVAKNERMPSHQWRNHAATSGVAESQFDEHFHQAHIGGSDYQRECRPRHAG